VHSKAHLTRRTDCRRIEAWRNAPWKWREKGSIIGVCTHDYFIEINQPILPSIQPYRLLRRLAAQNTVTKLIKKLMYIPQAATLDTDDRSCCVPSTVVESQHMTFSPTQLSLPYYWYAEVRPQLYSCANLCVWFQGMQEGLAAYVHLGGQENRRSVWKLEEFFLNFISQEQEFLGGLGYQLLH
jgi:hypothetical protein